MKSLKTLVLGTTVAVGVAGFVAGADASAHTSYKVQSGDTLSGISQKFGKDYSFVSSIASANGISNPNLIHVGTTLVIPDGTTTVRKTAQPVKQQTTHQHIKHHLNKSKNNLQSASTTKTTSANTNKIIPINTKSTN
ncbi:MAG: LysM peptidoglycan-binding domain-containing protein, partial [Kurthia sp.]|nr:LysM peptidoglycan-binding domain-containing protein [Kurthia sp.]